MKPQPVTNFGQMPQIFSERLAKLQKEGVLDDPNLFPALRDAIQSVRAGSPPPGASKLSELAKVPALDAAAQAKIAAQQVAQTRPMDRNVPVERDVPIERANYTQNRSYRAAPRRSGHLPRT